MSSVNFLFSFSFCISVHFMFSQKKKEEMFIPQVCKRTQRASTHFFSPIICDSLTYTLKYTFYYYLLHLQQKSEQVMEYVKRIELQKATTRYTFPYDHKEATRKHRHYYYYQCACDEMILLTGYAIHAGFLRHVPHFNISESVFCVHSLFCAYFSFSRGNCRNVVFLLCFPFFACHIAHI